MIATRDRGTLGQRFSQIRAAVVTVCGEMHTQLFPKSIKFDDPGQFSLREPASLE